MTYKWARDFALELLDRYSVAGQVVAEDYNGQGDALARIPKLVDDAQLYLATTAARMRAMVPLSSMSCDDNGPWRVYTLPADCWQLTSAGLVRFEGERLQRYHRYHPLTRRQIAVPASAGEGLMAEYFRYPRLLGEDPAEDAVLDNAMEAQAAIPYYVAAYLAVHDDPFVYQTMMNEFESRLARMGEVAHTDHHLVEDAYGEGVWSCG